MCSMVRQRAPNDNDGDRIGIITGPNWLLWPQSVTLVL